jgi:hypothetical protein
MFLFIHCNNLLDLVWYKTFHYFWLLLYVITHYFSNAVTGITNGRIRSIRETHEINKTTKYNICLCSVSYIALLYISFILLFFCFIYIRFILIYLKKNVIWKLRDLRSHSTLLQVQNLLEFNTMSLDQQFSVFGREYDFCNVKKYSSNYKESHTPQGLALHFNIFFARWQRKATPFASS